MTDQTQQQNQQVPQGQPMAAFGGSIPFSNVPAQPKKDDLANVVYGPNPEGQAIRIEKPETPKAPEAAPETQKLPENKPERVVDIERKDAKPLYPQNQQRPVVPQQQVQNAPAQQAKPSPNAPKFFGYMVSPQIANNFSLISSQKGKGDINKSRTWVYMLLDRILKKQTYAKKQSV